MTQTQSLTKCQPTSFSSPNLSSLPVQYPVTTTEYAEYLAATDYKPKETYNWLKNWEGTY